MAAEPQTEKPKAGKKLLVMIVVGVLVLVLILGGILAYFLTRSSGDDGHGEQEVSKEESKKKDKKKDKKKEEHAAPVFEKLETFTVNLSGGESMLQVELHVELQDDKMKETLKAYMPKIRNDINLLLRSKKLDDLRTDDGTKKLIEELRASVNHAMDLDEDEGVKSVAISSMIVQ